MTHPSQPPHSVFQEADLEEINFDDIAVFYPDPSSHKSNPGPYPHTVALPSGEPATLQADVAQAQEEAEHWHEERDHVINERDQLLKAQTDLLQEHTQLKEQIERMQQEGLLLQKSFSHERDVLNLREEINTKEKEILDLRDTLDQKERQILDTREKTRILEHARHQAEERLLEGEKASVAAREKAEALQKEKDLFVARERGLMVRLEEALQEIYNLEEKSKQFQQQFAAERIGLQAQIASKDQARLQSERVAQEQATALEARCDELLTTAAAHYQKQVQAVQEQAQQHYQALTDQYQQELMEQVAMLAEAHQPGEVVSRHPQQPTSSSKEREQKFSQVLEELQQTRTQLNRMEQRYLQLKDWFTQGLNVLGGV